MPRLLAMPAVLAALAAFMYGADAGRVQYQRLAAPSLDPYTNSPSRAQQRWLRDHFMRMAVFSPYFDRKISWFPNSLVYQDLYGIPRESPLVRDHPEWVLRDREGQRLYIPWGCAQGTCPQYAADIANPQFRDWWIARATSVLSHGYLGLWIDDVNMEFRVSDGSGRQVPPLDSTTGSLMTWEAWRGYVAAFVEQIRAAFPKAEIVHNSIWFAGPPGVRDADPAIQRQIRAADNLNVERGIATDSGLAGGTGIWSLYALLAYIDRIHSAGRGVTLEEYELTRPMQEYGLAGYFLISSGNDRFGDFSTNPSNWWSGYDVVLGTPLGPRTYHDGVYQRAFSCGLVLAGEPGLHPQEVTLPGIFETLDGRSVRSVHLSGREGVLLRGCESGAVDTIRDRRGPPPQPKVISNTEP